MPGVGAALVNLVGNGAATPAEFGAGRVQNHSHFANGFVVGGLYGLPGDLGVVVVLAIEKKIVAAGTSAVGRKADSVAGEGVAGARCLNARLGKEQLKRIAGKVGEAFHLGCGKIRTDFAGL